MNKIDRIQPRASYEADLARWSTEQAALIRQSRFDLVDLENVAEEIESLGRSDKREIGNRIGVILMHLLKWEFQPDQRKAGWLLSLSEQRHRVALLVKESPSLKNAPMHALSAEYAMARRKAAIETGLPITAFPPGCPYRTEDVLSEDFLPGEPWSDQDRYRD